MGEGGLGHLIVVGDGLGVDAQTRHKVPLLAVGRVHFEVGNRCVVAPEPREAHALPSDGSLEGCKAKVGHLELPTKPGLEGESGRRY